MSTQGHCAAPPSGPVARGAANRPPALPELTKGLWRENPVFISALGLCPALAVTNSAANGVAMGAASLFVLVMSSLLVSALRSTIPKAVRISTFIIVIATFVTVADMSLAALVPAVHRELGAFVPLIVCNCLILGRQEAFASRQPVRLAVADALGMGLGFGLALAMIGAIREVLGNGSLFDLPLFGPGFEPWVIMILPPGGFLVTGALLFVFAWVAQARQRTARRLAALEGRNVA